MQIRLVASKAPLPHGHGSGSEFDASLTITIGKAEAVVLFEKQLAEPFSGDYAQAFEESRRID